VRRHAARATTGPFPVLPRHDGESAPSAREEAAERDALSAIAVGGVLTIGEALFEGADRPALVRCELFERRAAVDVLRADVT
jgi:hypothetical protein